MFKESLVHRVIFPLSHAIHSGLKSILLFDREILLWSRFTHPYDNHLRVPFAFCTSRHSRSDGASRKVFGLGFHPATSTSPSKYSSIIDNKNLPTFQLPHIELKSICDSCGHRRCLGPQNREHFLALLWIPRQSCLLLPKRELLRSRPSYVAQLKIMHRYLQIILISYVT